MKREYFVFDTNGERQLSELELPLRIGGKKHSGIVIPGVADEQLLAIIALDDGHAYIQPAESGLSIFHNDERLLDSAWLKSGDRVQIADSILSWDIQGDRVLIQIQPHKLDIEQLRPPKQARTALPATDTLPVTAKAPATAGSKRLRRFALALVALLVLIATYLLMATSVSLRVEPPTATAKLSGFPPVISLAGSYLVFPGNYQLDISSPGYAAMKADIDIKMGPAMDLSYTLEELPGLVRVNTSPIVDLQLFVDGVETKSIVGGQYEMTRGPRSLRLETQRYLPQQEEIEVAGFGAEQEVSLVLEPAWAVVSISTSPAGADVLVDNSVIGITPIQAEILQGQHEIRLQMPGFKAVTLFRTIEPGQDFSLDEIQLEPVDARLRVSSVPSGASIRIGGKYFGLTPQTVEIAANTEQQLHLSKAGYLISEQGLELAPDEERSINIKMVAEYGTVFLKLQPAGVSLSINGKKSSQGSGRLRLQTLKNTIKASKPGYVSKTISVTPRAGVSQNIDISLVSEQQQQAEKQKQKKEAATPGLLTASGGMTLQLLQPQSNLKMGASRRDAGRRSNESQRLVKLQRPFYLAHKEVSNADFRRFKPSHNSGTVDSAALNGELQPVVNVSWDDAARYANWLSKRQGLPAAYREEAGKMLAVTPMTTGYRLPTEAEWAWAARREGLASEQRYPWLGGYPPTSKSGNYADARIADTLADVVPNYDDGYRGTAPVASFPATAAGFFDLGGNVAEWMHDKYAIYPGEASRLVIDPMGPATGQHHVVRGSSWRHGSISELRYSYRDYSSKPRPDLGFRIARYAE